MSSCSVLLCYEQYKSEQRLATFALLALGANSPMTRQDYDLHLSFIIQKWYAFSNQYYADWTTLPIYFRYSCG